MTAFTPRTVTIGAHEQAQRLRLCGIDPALYGDEVDPSAFTAFAIQEAERAVGALPAGVHAGQRLTIRRVPLLGEQLTVTAEMAAPVPADRGEIVRFVATLRDQAGNEVIRTTENLFVPDPAAPPKEKKGDNAPARGVRTVEHGVVSFTPEAVAAYCGPAVNPVHFDPAPAAAAGFRAPIIGGEQGVRHIIALIWRTQRPAALDISLRFLRPLFWDDDCVLSVELTDGAWNTVSLTKQGKKATELTIHH